MSSSSLAVVFGAAGGIGRAAVDCYAERSCRVAAVDLRTPDGLAAPVVHFAHHVDRHDHEVFSQIRERFDGPVDHVAIAIGGAVAAEVEADEAILLEARPDLLGEVLRTNVAEVITIVSGMLPHLSDRGSASVTIASSINAHGDFGYPYYSAAKAALEGFIRSSARHLGQRGVRINAVSFGTVLTKRSRELHAESGPAHYLRLERLSATGRLTTEREAGLAMVSLALDLTNVTGTVLTCDGGQSLPGGHSLR